jgi:hypothetical protein
MEPSNPSAEVSTEALDIKEVISGSSQQNETVTLSDSAHAQNMMANGTNAGNSTCKPWKQNRPVTLAQFLRAVNLMLIQQVQLNLKKKTQLLESHLLYIIILSLLYWKRSQLKQRMALSLFRIKGEY